MTEQTTTATSVCRKLMQARIALQGMKLSKSGRNDFAKYKYFELGDFLPAVQEIFLGLGLCGYVTFSTESAVLNIIDTETDQTLYITSPMATASLKGAHDIQNLGAVQTYLRRYLWVTAMEIVEHDALDAVLGSDQQSPAQQLQESRQAAARQPEHIESPQPEMQDQGVTDAFVSAAYEAMERAGLNSTGVKTLLVVLGVNQLQDVQAKHRAKLLRMMTADYAKMLNLGKNSRGEQIIELPDSEVDAPSIDELEREAKELF